MYEEDYYDDDWDYELDWDMDALHKHKKGDKVKWILTAIAFVLIAVMLVGLCLQVFGTGKQKPTEWFGNDEKTEQATELMERRVMSAPLRSAASSPYFDFDAWKSSYGAANFVRDYGEQVTGFGYSSEVYLYVNDDRMDESVYVKMYAARPSGSKITNVFVCLDTTNKTIPSYTPNSIEVDEWYESDSAVKIDPYMYLFVFDNGLTGYDYRLYVTQTASELPSEPTKDGYTFVGWYLDEALTIPYKGEPITSDMTFYAKFEINRYTVTFNSNEGSEIPSKTVDWNTVVTTKTPTRTGYNFKGWFLPDGTKYTNQAVTSDITLTAQWDIILCKVVFYVDGEKYEEMTVEYGMSLVTVVNRASEINLRVMSVKTSSGAPVTSFTDAIVSENVEVQAEKMTGTDKVKNTVRNSWLQVVIAAISVTLLAGVIAVTVSKVKRTR